MSIEEVLLILNALVYSNGVNEKSMEKNVYDLVEDGLLKPDDAIATKEEWNALIRTIKQNETYFSKVKLVDIESKKEAQKNVTFINENVNADRKQEVYVVFKGTGSLEWHDNAKGALLMVPLTPQQQNALNYANRIAKDYSQYDFIVSGHSKGGNKAQVVTLLCDKVKAGYSFDGQGMGKGFMIKYRLQIEQNQHKLVSISNRSDFVNSLFKSVAGKVKFTNNTGNLLDWLMSGDKDIAMHQHSPLAMFEIKDGYLRMFDTKGIKQDSTSLFLGNMVDYFREHMSEDDFETFANLVMHMFETGGCGDKHFDIKNIDPEFWVRLINHILKYGEELGMKENDMLLLLSNLSIFIPDDSVWGYVLEAIKLFRNPGGILADAIIADETPRRLNEIMVEYNSKYSEVMKKKEIIRDFSSEAQEAMRDSLACEIDRSQLSMESTPGWGYVAEILSDTGVLESHHKVEELCNELLDTCEVTEAKYNKIIEEVYAKDHEFAQRLKKKTDRIRDYRAVIRKARNK